jgi:DNA-binding NarL/FixJ family response regulator
MVIWPKWQKLPLTMGIRSIYVRIMNVHSYAAANVSPVADVDVVAPAAPQDRPLRVLVVHDHDVIRSGFRLLLGRLPWVDRCLGARDVAEATALWNRYEPHVALIDLFVDDVAGTDLCRQLRRQRPHGHVLLMSANERISPSAATAAGASGFISTGSSGEDIAQAVRLAGLGRSAARPPAVSFGLLSGRQREVLRLLAGGATNREIAQSLCLSPHTVKGHTTDLYKRLQVRNRAEAVLRAQRVGLLV